MQVWETSGSQAPPDTWLSVSGGAGARSRGLGHGGDKEARTHVERTLLGERGLWEAGRPSVVRVRPHPRKV